MDFDTFSFLPRITALAVIAVFAFAALKIKKAVANSSEVKSGLGGWLILVGVVLFLGPLILLAGISETFSQLFKEGTYAALANPGSEAYNPLLYTFIWVEILINTVMFCASIYLIFLFFSKKTFFPQLFIWVKISSFFFIILDTVLVKLILPDEQLEPGTMKEIAQSGVWTSIWVSYMQKSKRVKATFTR